MTKLSQLLGFVGRTSPPARKLISVSWYRYVSWRYRNPELTFMNYGFADLDPSAPLPPLFPEDEPYRPYIQLYEHLAGRIRLEDRDVLEVGCGRGGGASYVMRYLRPASLTAVDVVARSVAFCRARHPVCGLNFLQGDAEAMPLPDDAFDVVLNIESCHCYSSMARFLAEVSRVLRQGGLFLMADFWPAQEIATLRRRLAAAGFERVREQVITPNVLRALDEDHGRKVALIRAHVFPLFRGLFARAAGLKGTEMYEAFRRGEFEYLSYIARKPEVPAMRWANPI